MAYAVQGRGYRLSRRRRGDPVRGCVGMGITELLSKVVFSRLIQAAT
jgi:hypothetical protein